MNTPVILVVEDEAALRVVASKILESLGYQVKTAADGEEGLQVVSQPGTIDLVFSDVRMPRCSGPEFVSKARRLRPGLRAIFTSGYSRAAGHDLFEGFEEEKSLPLLPKPYNVLDLATTISEALLASPRAA